MLTEVKVRPWPSLPGLRGVGAGDGSDFTVAIIEGDKNVLLCSFKSTSEQCQANYDWKVGGRLNMNCISYYWIYSIYSNWRISDGPAWGDVEKAASCEQGCQVHVHLLNKRRSCWLRQLCLFLLAQHVLHQVWISFYYWTAHNLVDTILLTTQIHK